MPRLQKILAQAGVASRRHAEELIQAGRVTINGQVATLGQSAEYSDRIAVDGRVIEVSEGHKTYILYKPKGVITTASDEAGRKTVLDLMPDVPGLHPVGRLDRLTEGLLILTTDGDLTLKLTHPRYQHEKEYRIWTEDEVTDQDLDRLEDGIELEDGITQPALAKRAPEGLYLTIREGRNRQVRRMMEAIGKPVRRLVRVRLGGLTLRGVRPGEYRHLTQREIEVLLQETCSPRERTRLHEEWDYVKYGFGKRHGRAQPREESPGTTGQDATLTAGRRADQPPKGRGAKSTESATETRPLRRPRNAERDVRNGTRRKR